MKLIVQLDFTFRRKTHFAMCSERVLLGETGMVVTLFVSYL